MYKVVRKSRGRLYSATISKHFGAMPSIVKKWIVKYEPNKWIKAKVGKLFVFNKLDDAISFAQATLFRHFDEIEIWRCKTIDSRKMPLIGMSIHRFLFFWTSDHPHSPILTTPPPTGTLVVSKVMLTKRVRVWNEIKQLSRSRKEKKGEET